METEQKLALLQNVYAAALAETVNTYAKLNVLEPIVAQKKTRQAQTAPYMIQQLGIHTVADVFARLTEVFGCANWTVSKTENGYTAQASSCKLCALCKKMGGANPCEGWCLDPMAAMISAVTNGKNNTNQLKAESTLMNADCCRINIMT